MATNKKVYMEVTCVEVEEGVGLDEKGRVLAPPFSHMLRHIKDEDEEEPVSPSTSGVGHAVRLYHYNELPNFLRGNPFITSGYRVYLPTRLCLKSMFSLTNETFNIWTHVLGFVYFSLVLLEDNIVLIPEAEGNYGDHFTFSIMNICYLVRCAKTVPFSLHLSRETLPLTPSPLTPSPPHPSPCYLLTPSSL
jgi:hypothetical protein